MNKKTNKKVKKAEKETIKKNCRDCFYNPNPYSEECINCKNSSNFINVNSSKAKQIIKKKEERDIKFSKALENIPYITTNDKGEIVHVNPFNKILEELKTIFTDKNERIAYLQEELLKAKKGIIEEETVKDETVPLERLSYEEARRIARFRNKHWKKCKNSGRYIYDLEGTGVGTVIKIKCPICGEELDVTDVENW